MQAVCDKCHGHLELAVAEGRWGPIVSSRCESCLHSRAPYEGPGAREAIFAARSRTASTSPGDR